MGTCSGLNGYIHVYQGWANIFCIFSFFSAKSFTFRISHYFFKFRISLFIFRFRPALTSSVDVSSSVVETCTSSMNETTTTSRLPKDALKAQLTVSNVFERFERIVRDCNLRPPVTFIIFFIHELAAAPQTEYWRRLVSIMPVNLIFGLSHLDPHAIPLDLFMRLYDPKDEKNRKLCLHYAFMIKKLGNI
uniref:Mediator of RNA polymerase II transcription subunit 23 n=1 Tax=Meloidogyne incognita TaxID=6306 RepID=A0A914LP76_MELIC